MSGDNTPRLSFPPGGPPRVVAAVSTAHELELAVRQAARLPFDLLEIRCGEALLDPAALAGVAAALRAAGKPVLATVRNRAEGGGWVDDDPARLEWFSAALRCCDAVDIEQSSLLAARVCALADAAGRTVVLSWHDFTGTPPALELATRMASAASACTRPLFKAACLVRDEADLQSLRVALAGRPTGLPVCVIGMGGAGASSRLEFPLLGSALTYGYLEEPTAPGQLSCRTLREYLVVQSPAYRKALAGL